MKTLISRSRFLVLLLGLLTMCVTQVWAEEVVYKQTSTSAASVNSGTAPTGSSVTFSNTYTTKEQLTSGKKMTLTLKGYAGYKITQITLSMKSNGNAGAGYLDVKAGSTTLASIGSSSSGVAFNNAKWNGSYTTSYTNVTPTMSDAAYDIKNGEDVVITIGATTNSLYCQSFAITYEPSVGGDPDPGTGGSGEWTKVTSLSEIAAGYKYLIVSNGATKYMMSSSVVSNRFSNGAAATISGNTVTNATIAENCQWEIFKSGDYYYIKQDSKYAGGTTTKNQGAMIATQTDLTKWTVTVTDGEFDFVNYGRSQQSSDYNNKYLRSNTTNGWACYTTGTGAKCMLFRQASGPATYTASIADPAPSNGSILLSTDGSSFADGPLEGLENESKFYFTVTPEDGYQLKSGSLKVNDSETGIEGPDANGVYSYTINNANAVVSAVFEQKPYSITVSYVGEGNMGIADFAVSGENPRGLVRGASADIAAIAETGYEFVNWTVSPVGAVTFTNSEAEETSFTVSQTIDGAATITANFVALDVYGIKAYFEGGAEDEYQNFTMNNESGRYELAYTLPAGNKKFWVGTNAWSSNFSGNWEFGGRFTFGNGTNSYLGEGADVTLYIDPTKKNEANSNLDIKADFTYQVAFKSGETWTHLPFALVDGYKYETEEVTISGAYFDGNWDYYVGAKKTDGGTTFIPNKSHKGTYGESSQANFLLKEVAGLTSNNGTVKGKFRIWANSTDRNWYCTFVPVYSYVMMNGDEIYASEEISSEAGSLVTTIYATEPVKDGYHFAGWSRTADKSTFDNENDMAAGADYTYWKYNDVLYPVWQKLYTIVVGPESAEKGTATFEDKTDSKDLLSGTQVTITAAPLIGYVFDGWSTEDDITIEDASAATTTITVKEADAMIVANFVDAPSHNAIWSVNGHETTVSYKEGLTIALAADPTENIPDGYVFKGWYEGDYEDASTAPTYVTEPGTMAQADRTFKAVFAKETEVAGTTYNLVESALADYSGDYLIVYNNTYAMNTHSGNQNTNTFATYTDVSEYYTEETKSIASNTTTDALVYRAAKTTNGYSLYCVSDESYLGITANTTSTGAKLRWNTAYTESADDWTLGVGSVRNVGSNTLYIRWNNNSGSYRFAAYASNGQQAVQLFKKPVRTETSNYCTSYTKMYDVKYVVDGEEDTDLAQEVAENTTPVAVAEPTKVGYTFNGWYAVPECTGEKVVPTGVTITEDKTFYGKFDVNNYAITLDKNGASADGSASVNYDATAVTTISHVAAWAGHELKGYYTATDNDEKVLNADGTFAGNVAGWIVDGKWAKAEAATLYAQWNVLANCTLGAELVGCTAAGENVAEVIVNTENVVLNYVLDANRTWTGATVSVTMGMETLVANTDYTFTDGVLTFSTPITGNVSVTISAPYAPATLTLSAIGNEYNHGANLKVTDEITLPETVDVLAAGKTFMGWSTVEIPTEGAAPAENFYAKGAQYTIASATDRLYAVYATETPGAVSWNKVTASAADWSGDYLLVYNDAVAWTGVDASSCGAAVTVSNNVIATKPDGAAILTIAEMTGGYSIQVNGDQYVGHEGAKNGMTFSENEILNTISYSDEISVVSGTNMNLRYNKSSDQQRFRYYGSGQEAISLFKKTFGASTYSNYTTSGTLHVDAPTFNIETKPGTYTDKNHQVRLNVPAGTTVYYTLNGDAPDNTSTEYVDGITLSETATVKAVAYVGENASEVLEGLFTINHFTDFAAMQEAIEPNTNVGMTLTNAYVLGVYSLSKQLFVQMDGKGMVLTCTAIPDGIEIGKKLTGEITGQFIMNLGRPQINACVLDAGMVVEDGVRPAVTLLTQVDETTVDANLLTLVQVNNIYSISKSSNDIVMNTQADGEGDVINVNNLLNAVENTLPEQELACNVIGIFNVKTDQGVTTYSIIPVLKSDFAVVTPKLAELPTVDVAGSTDSENPMEVAVNKQLTITKPAAGYTGKYSFNGAAATTMTASSYNVTITNADEAESLTLTSTRPYYNDNSVTYYYKANSALNEYDINYPAVQSYVGISGAASALPGSEVVLTGTVKVEHYHLGAVTVSKADDETTTVEVVREGNTYTFTMPEYAVNVKIGYTKDPTFSVTYQKGGKAATGDDPSETAKYEGDVVTLKPNTWKAAGYTFDHWKVVYTDAEAQEVEVTVTDGQFVMPAYAVKVIAQWNELLYSKPGAWELVTDASELAAGDYVIFAGKKDYTWYAGTSTDKNANRNLQVVSTVSVDNNALTYTGEDITECIFQIEDGNSENSYAFYSEKRNGYLNANGTGTDNYMTITTAKNSANASWKVNSISSSDGEATVQAQSSNRNVMNLNLDNTLFAAYSAKSYKLKIFKFYPTARKAYFEANAGEDAVSNMPSMVRANATTNIATIPADVPTRKGYTFSSWNSAQNGQGVRSAQPGENLELWQAECTLYAQWTLNKHAVTVADVEHGTITAKPYGMETIAEGANADVDYNKMVVIAYTEDDEEYAFKAWKVYKTDDESEEMTLNYGQTSTTFEMPDYPVTVSAVFESKASIEYTLTYDANGGTGEMDGNPFTKNWNTYITVSDNKNGEDDIFTKSNCTFNGWNTKADGTGTAYAAGAHFYIKSDVTLYAQWKGTGVTYTLKDKETVNISDGAAPTGSSAIYAQTYSTMGQMTAGNTATLTLTGYDGKLITGVTISMKSNSNSGAGTIKVNVSGVEACSTSYAETFGANSSSYQTKALVGFKNAYVQPGTTIVVKCAATANSIYLRDVVVEYIDVDYTRDVTATYGTICLGHGVDAGDFFGATFYEGDYLLMQGGMPYKYYLSEVDHLEAGMPYVFVKDDEAEQIAMIYNNETNTAQSRKGLVGTLDVIWDYASGDMRNTLEGNYFIYDNEFRKCGAWCGLNANRAYLDINKADVERRYQEKPAQAGARKRIALTNSAAQTTTGFDGLTEDGINDTDVRKVMIENHIYVIRGGMMFDLNGSRVK